MHIEYYSTVVNGFPCILVYRGNEPSHLLLLFNISCSTTEELVNSSELRIYKESISPETLDEMSTELCNLNDGVTIIALADLGQDDTMQVVGRVALTREELLIDKWIVFYHFTSTYIDWVNYNNSDGMAVELALKGACDGIAVTELGFIMDPDREPLLVAFLELSNPDIDMKLYEEMMESSGKIERSKRQSPNNSNGACKKYPYMVCSMYMLHYALCLMSVVYCPNQCHDNNIQ